MNFGDYIRELRNAQGISQRQLAMRVGISNSEISRIESGERALPRVTSIKALAMALGVDEVELLKKVGCSSGTSDNEMDVLQGSENKHKHNNYVELLDRAWYIYEKDSQLMEVAYKVASSGLTNSEIGVIKAVTENMLEQFKKNKGK